MTPNSLMINRNDFISEDKAEHLLFLINTFLGFSDSELRILDLSPIIERFTDHFESIEFTFDEDGDEEPYGLKDGLLIYLWTEYKFELIVYQDENGKLVFEE